MTVAPGSDIEAQDIIKSVYMYAADAGANDTYVISLPTAPSAYVDGLTVRFKANTANTGACSLNVNSLGAIAIKRPDTTDTQTGDIIANQIVEVVYRNGNFYMISPSPIDERFIVGTLKNTSIKTYFNIQLPFILWTGSQLNATTTDSPNWARNNGNPVATYLGAFCDFQTGTSVASSIYLDLFYGGAGTRFIMFNGTNKIILDWWAKLPATATGDIQMGFCSEEAALRQVYNSSSTGARVTISQHGTDGKIYAHINEEGVGHTETEITGITVTNYNNYRIELDLGTDANFYVNGVLQYTYSGANLETDAITLGLGFGRSGTAHFIVTAPTLSLEMNP